MYEEPKYHRILAANRSAYNHGKRELLNLKIVRFDCAILLSW